MKKDLEDWEVEEFEGKNILFYKGKNYIPNDSQLQHNIVQKYHDHPTAGHPGELQTFNAVKEHYWWPGLWVFVKNYLQGCGTCQQFKIDRNPTKPAFMPLEGAKSTQPFTSCSMDLITDLSPVDGCNSILVMVDRGNTKGAIPIPTTKTLTQEGAGQLLLDNLYKQFETKCSQTEHLNLLPWLLGNSWNSLESTWTWQWPTILKLMELLNESIRK